MQKTNSTSAVVGVVLLGLGALFLIAQVFSISLIAYLWPFFIIGPGLLCFAGMALGGKRAGPLAIPGSIVTMVGLILLYQNTFNHWESWAYAWALIMPTSIGLGLMINGAWSEVDGLIKVGSRFAGVGLAVFFLFGFLFEVIFNISGSNIASVVWPLVLIGIGVWLLNRQTDDTPPPANDKVNEFEKMRPIPTPREDERSDFEPLDMDRINKKE